MSHFPIHSCALRWLNNSFEIRNKLLSIQPTTISIYLYNNCRNVFKWGNSSVSWLSDYCPVDVSSPVWNSTKFLLSECQIGSSLYVLLLLLMPCTKKGYLGNIGGALYRWRTDISRVVATLNKGVERHNEVSEIEISATLLLLLLVFITVDCCSWVSNQLNCRGHISFSGYPFCACALGDSSNLRTCRQC